MKGYAAFNADRRDKKLIKNKQKELFFAGIFLLILSLLQYALAKILSNKLSDE
jgi:hypothetical protein